MAEIPSIPTISGLEARGRINPMSDPGMLAEIENAKALMSAQHLAAVQLIAKTPEGEKTQASGTGYIDAIGGTIRDAFKPIAGALALAINNSERTIAPHGKSQNFRG